MRLTRSATLFLFLIISCISLLIFIYLNSFDKTKNDIFRIKNTIASRTDSFKSIKDKSSKDKSRYISHVAYNHYIDTGDERIIENFKFFMKIAYEPCHPEIHYTFLLNQDDLKKDIYETLLKFIEKDIVDQLKECSVENSTSKRENKNTRLFIQKNWRDIEFCGYVSLFNSSYMKEKRSYFDYFFFINSSARGPFLPNYWFRPWWEMFTDILKMFPRTAAVGPFFNCEFHPHVQSFFIALSKKGLEIFLGSLHCRGPNETDRLRYIIDTEVEAGKRIFAEGYEMRTLLSIHRNKYNSSHFKDCKAANPTFGYPDDVRGLAVNIHEVVWIKFGGSVHFPHYTNEYAPYYSRFLAKNIIN